MMALIVFVLLGILAFTSSLVFIRITAKTLMVGAIVWVISVMSLSTACEAKKLPWSFCGEITGAINIVASGGFNAVIAMAITATVLIVINRKKK